MSKVITVDAFFAQNPLWKLLKLKEGEDKRATMSYKSGNVNSLIECKQCGEQAERRGNAGYKCLRCRRDVGVENGVITLIEPTSAKELNLREKGMSRDPKEVVDPDLEEDEEEEEPVVVAAPKKAAPKKALKKRDDDDDDEMLARLKHIPRKASVKKPVAPVVPVEDSDDEEPANGVFLDLDFLTKSAAKTSGYSTAAETAAKTAAVVKRKAHLEARKARAVKDDEEAARDITETVAAPVPVPAKKQSEVFGECSALITQTIVLKSGDIYYAGNGIMIRVE